MKRGLWIVTAIVVVGLITASFFYLKPKKVTNTVDGIIYKLGEDDRSMEQPVTIHIDGELRKNLKGARTFTGYIDIEGDELPVPDEYRSLKLKFRETGVAEMLYVYNENGTPKHYPYGSIYINKNFSRFTIMKNEITKTPSNQTVGSWSGEDGTMISAPAHTRVEALQITNELMEEYSDGYVFK